MCSKKFESGLLGDEYRHPWSSWFGDPWTRRQSDGSSSGSTASVRTYSNASDSDALSQHVFGHQGKGQPLRQQQYPLQRGDGKETEDGCLDYCDGSYTSRNSYHVVLTCMIVTTITICVYIMYKIYEEKTTLSSYHVPIRVPCNDLTEFFPVTSVHQYTDDITNQRFKDAGIRRFKGKDNNTSCELPVGSVLNSMATNDNLVKGQVFLKVGDTGPSLEFSKYTLSIYKDRTLTNIETDRYSIIIPTDGMYFLYFGVSLSYTANMCKDSDFKTAIAHLLRQQSPLDRLPKILMAAEHTCCETCEVERHTEFTGGLFQLKKDDRLFIQVSSPELLAKDDDSTFLGIVQLSSTHPRVESVQGPFP